MEEQKKSLYLAESMYSWENSQYFCPEKTKEKGKDKEDMIQRG
jgi:hypothetical protein